MEEEVTQTMLMGKSKVRSDVSQVTLWFWLLHFLITNVIKKKRIVKEKSTDSKKDYPEERIVEMGWNLKVQFVHTLRCTRAWIYMKKK